MCKMLICKKLSQDPGVNPIPGGLWTHPFPMDVILNTPSNFWTTDDRELKFYMVIDIHKLFWKTEKEALYQLGWKCWLCSYDIIIMQNYRILGQILPK